MSLSAGTRVGPFEVQAPIGAGGMGEVYRARDAKLKRDVALKVLPAAFASDPYRMARFQREAEVLASLNHPNIAVIYGVEDRALVMELVEGESPKGPLTLEDAWHIASQIASALEYAHDRGIVHRDLKPANIKVTPDGKVKLLDFGLAKAFNEPVAATPADTSNSPTLTMEAATEAGVILGTAAYMSPEQAKGKPVDKRADIWAFGVVLYELLTGKKLFDGADASEILAAVIRHEPKLDDVPVKVRSLLQACLERDPTKRLRDIGDSQRLIDAAVANTEQTAKRKRRWPFVIAIAAGLVIAGLIATAPWKMPAPSSRPLMRLDADLGAELSRGEGAGPTLAISPDGKRLAFISPGLDGKDHLALRLLDNSQAAVLAGTEGAQSPFFSPDGRSVGYFADGKLKKMSVEGGAPVTLANARNPRGAVWGGNGSILFAAENRVGLSQVSQSGGTTQPATELDEKEGEISNRYPQLLPDGDTILFTARTAQQSWNDASIKVQSIKTGRRKTLVTGGYYGRYLPSGHLVYVHDGTLQAVRMNLDRLELFGAAYPIIQDMGRSAGNGFSKFDFTSSGTLIYIAEQDSDQRSVSVLDDSGVLKPLGVPDGPYGGATLSPDGTRFVFLTSDAAGVHFSIYDLVQKRVSKLADFNGRVNDLIWTADGKHLAFATENNQLAGPGIYWIRADGAGEPQRLLEGPAWVLGSFSPDGKVLGYWHREAPYGLWTLPLDLADPEHPQPGKPMSLLPMKVETRGPNISPDGQWIAYTSYQSGRQEAYVRPYARPGKELQISIDGSLSGVLWSPNGRQLVFTAPDERLRVVDYKSGGDSFTMDQPRVWSDKLPSGSRYLAGFMPDGKHLVIALPTGPGSDQKPTHAVFLLNFFEELQRRLPAGK